MQIQRVEIDSNPILILEIGVFDRVFIDWGLKVNVILLHKKLKVAYQFEKLIPNSS